MRIIGQTQRLALAAVVVAGGMIARDTMVHAQTCVDSCSGVEGCPPGEPCSDCTPESSYPNCGKLTLGHFYNCVDEDLGRSCLKDKTIVSVHGLVCDCGEGSYLTEKEFVANPTPQRCADAVVGSGCNPDFPACDHAEICGNGLDDDCDPDTPDACSSPDEGTAEICCNGTDDNDNGQIDEGCSSIQCMNSCNSNGEPVSMGSREMYIGPYRLAHIASDLGGSADLDLTATYDSARASSDDVALSANRDYEYPAPRIAGPGFRLSYSDELVLQGDDTDPSLVYYDSPVGRIAFFRDPDVTTWTSERGTNYHLRRSGSAYPYVWRLLTPGGDLLEFTQGNPTLLHPLAHVRLTAVYPGGARNRKVRLL